MLNEKIDLRHDMRKTAVDYFTKVEQLEALTAEVERLKQELIVLIVDNGKDTESTASGKTDRMEATIQYKGEAHHLRFSLTCSKGRVNNTAAIKEANRRIKALGGIEVNPNDFRGDPTYSEKLEWLEKAARKSKK